MELISIIIPIYNVSKYLNRCVDSVVNQTYKNIEIILVDDGSKDNSGEMCDKYQEEYSNIKVVHKENAGLGFARNTGLEYVTGKYVIFVDGDDYIQKDMVENLYNDLKKQMPILPSEVFAEYIVIGKLLLLINLLAMFMKVMTYLKKY